jgi:hypothetical protein
MMSTQLFMLINNEHRVPAVTEIRIVADVEKDVKSTG